ncbi:MAG: toprim domain-containing protein [Bacteroidota bacterium]|nr:toprim domain-containing protein [Bacteroidota bacterium]
MNCTTANKMSIAGFLLSKGINPQTYNSKSFLYCSPLRNEKTASFKVDRVKNIWYDFGTGTGGRLIDLVCQMYRVEVPGALLILSGSETPTQSFSFDQPQENTRESNLTIKHIQPLQNRALIQYLESRSIPANIAAKYTNEAYYTITNPDTGEIKKYFAVCFKNIAGGYELRNKYFKGSTSPKSYSIIPGHPEHVNIFEGFLDLLSAMVYYQQPEPRNTTIVLNSLSHLHHLWETLPTFNQVNLYLDNDQAGLKAANEIQTRFPVAVNKSKILFPQYKDFNEFLINP